MVIRNTVPEKDPITVKKGLFKGISAPKVRQPFGSNKPRFNGFRTAID